MKVRRFALRAAALSLVLAFAASGASIALAETTPQVSVNGRVFSYPGTSTVSVSDWVNYSLAPAVYVAPVNATRKINARRRRVEFTAPRNGLELNTAGAISALQAAVDESPTVRRTAGRTAVHDAGTESHPVRQDDHDRVEAAQDLPLRQHQGHQDLPLRHRYAALSHPHRHVRHRTQGEEPVVDQSRRCLGQGYAGLHQARVRATRWAPGRSTSIAAGTTRAFASTARRTSARSGTLRAMDACA